MLRIVGTLARKAAGLLLVLVVTAGLVSALIAFRPSSAPGLAAGGAPPAAGQDPVASLDPSASPAPTVSLSCAAGGAGLTDFITSDGPPASIANKTQASKVVVVATVGTVEPAVWNTVDGKHDPLDGSWPPGLAIYTPVTLTSPSGVLGAAPPQAMFLGGAVGCDRMVAHGRPIPATGARVAVFLAPSLTASGMASQTSMSAIAAWPVDASGNVLTPNEGSVTLVSFARSVQAVAAGG